MSKDKGSKNHKKAPADKSSGKAKVVSAYKAESKSSQSSGHSLEAFIPKTNPKTGGSNKS